MVFLLGLLITKPISSSITIISQADLDQTIWQFGVSNCGLDLSKVALACFFQFYTSESYDNLSDSKTQIQKVR